MQQSLCDAIVRHVRGVRGMGLWSDAKNDVSRSFQPGAGNAEGMTDGMGPPCMGEYALARVKI